MSVQKIEDLEMLNKMLSAVSSQIEKTEDKVKRAELNVYRKEVKEQIRRVLRRRKELVYNPFQCLNNINGKSNVSL